MLRFQHKISNLRSPVPKKWLKKCCLYNSCLCCCRSKLYFRPKQWYKKLGLTDCDNQYVPLLSLNFYYFQWCLKKPGLWTPK